MTATRIGRTVADVPVDAMSSAASFVSREWGDNYRIGYAGRWFEDVDDPERAPFYVFQALASDGSRFLVGADRWGNTRHFSGNLARMLGETYDVETHD